MKALILALTMVIALSGIAHTAGKTEETVKVSLGKRATAERGRIKIQFLEVIEDSRCPRDATCIWAGNAKVRISVSRGTGAPRIVELNTLTEPRNQILYGYEFELKDLQPQQGETAQKSSTTVLISIRRK